MHFDLVGKNLEFRNRFLDRGIILAPFAVLFISTSTPYLITACSLSLLLAWLVYSMKRVLRLKAMKETIHVDTSIELGGARVHSISRSVPCDQVRLRVEEAVAGGGTESVGSRVYEVHLLHNGTALATIGPFNDRQPATEVIQRISDVLNIQQ